MKMLLLIFVSIPAFAVERFEIKLLGDHMHIASPAKTSDGARVMIKSESFTPVIGVLEAKGVVIERFMLRPGKFRLFTLGPEQLSELSYMSLTPPSQKVFLKAGAGSYEIPKKD